MSYLYYGRTVSRSELIRNAFMCYRPDWDFALNVLEGFESAVDSHFEGPVPGLVIGPGLVIDPAMFFGYKETPSTIKRWLQSLSVRGLIAVQVCGATYRSILLAYRLLPQKSVFTPEWLAHGVIAFCPCEDLGSKEEVVWILNRIKTFAGLPEEPSD